jgi:phospholipase A1
MLRTHPSRPLLLLPLLMMALAPSPCRAIPPAADFQIIRTGAGLTLHKEMFILPYTYSDEYKGRRAEAVFQLSAKHRLFNTRFYFAYTQISFWQAYDYPNSAPFRDTNYNPEIFYRFKPLPYQSGLLGADAGFEHESNGQLVPLSRSWNLLYLVPYFQLDNLLLYVKLRYRIPEKAKDSPDDAEGDDNPDITDFLGHTDVHLYYRFLQEHMIHLEMRGVLGSGKGNVSLNYSYPLPRGEGSYLMLRLSHGYGESLMDYRKSLSRIGVGIMFAR